MNIGENIAKLRKDRDLTQEELAIKINVSAKTISSYETNRSLPNIEILILLANTLETNINEILGLTNENAKKITTKYQKKHFKNSLLKFIFISIMLIIPIFHFGSAFTINFASILVEYQESGTFDPINMAKRFDANTFRIMKSYFIYTLIILFIYILYLKKKKLPLLIIGGVMLILFTYDFVVYRRFYTNIILLIPSIISIVAALKIAKKW